MTDAFRDALAAALWDGGDLNSELMADSILAMPEMQAIRTYLRSEAEFGLDTPEGQRWYRLTMASRLPESVVRWVLGGPS